jgi:hypothetical protein
VTSRTSTMRTDMTLVLPELGTFRLRPALP